MIDKSKILSAPKLAEEKIVVKAWADDKHDGTIVVRELTASQRDAFEASLVVQGSKKVNLKDIRAKLVAWSVYDEEGNKIFNEGDIELLSQQPASVMDEIYTVAQKLSKFTDEDVEELVKN